MQWLTLILCLMAMAMALRQIRDNRRRGIGVEWTKTMATAGGVIVITLLAVGVLIAATALRQPTVGVVLFIVVFVVGLIALILAVNRRWPPQKAS